QRSGGEEAGKYAQVETRDSVGTASGWISSDCLAIGKIDDHEQCNDGRADGNDVLHAEQAERNQQAEGGFRAVGSGTECVQAKDGNAFLDADLFGALIAGFEGLANDDVEDVHS